MTNNQEALEKGVPAIFHRSRSLTECRSGKPKDKGGSYKNRVHCMVAEHGSEPRQQKGPAKDEVDMK